MTNKALRNPNVKILIIDDDKEFLEEIQELLTLTGYQIHVSSDGENALSLVRTLKPDIIFLDLKMSPKSGFQVADELRNALGMKDTAVIAMTGFFTEKEHTLLMKMCGIRTCIIKPVKPLDLISKIEFEIEQKRIPSENLQYN